MTIIMKYIIISLRTCYSGGTALAGADRKDTKNTQRAKNVEQTYFVTSFRRVTLITDSEFQYTSLQSQFVFAFALIQHAFFSNTTLN